MTTPLRVLIVDDEPPARRRVRDLLEAEPDVVVAAECGSGREAAEAIRTLAPDLVFLDVQMPEGDGFWVVEEVGAERMPAVIFVTAYDEFALRAFEVHALDYLLKPFDRERFGRALQHARAHRRAAAADPRLLALLEGMRPPRAGYLERLPVRTGPRIRLVTVDEVDYMEAADNYVSLWVAGRACLVRETMSGLEARLDPARFLRIHRSLIVNLARVEELEPLFSGEYVVTLRGGTRLTSGRSYRAKLQEVLGLRS